MSRPLLAGAVLLGSAAAALAAPTGGSAYFFGDSLTDCCNYGRTTNGPNWADLLPPLIGESYVATGQSNYAFGGAQSGGVLRADFLSQVARFTASGTTIAPNDIVGIWIGTNDAWSSSFSLNDTLFGQPVVGPIGRLPAVSVLTNYIMGNIRSGIDQLVADGFRNVVVLSPYDLGQAAVEPNPAAAALATQYATALTVAERGLSTPGVNTYVVDVESLFQQVEANPGAYGFTHPNATDNCLAAGCEYASPAVQDTYVFEDILHTTTAFDRLVANDAAAIVNAGPVAVPEPGSAIALLAGLLGFGSTRRRRKHRPG